MYVKKLYIYFQIINDAFYLPVFTFAKATHTTITAATKSYFPGYLFPLSQK